MYICNENIKHVEQGVDSLGRQAVAISTSGILKVPWNAQGFYPSPGHVYWEEEQHAAICLLPFLLAEFWLFWVLWRDSPADNSLANKILDKVMETFSHREGNPVF